MLREAKGRERFSRAARVVCNFHSAECDCLKWFPVECFLRKAALVEFTLAQPSLLPQELEIQSPFTSPQHRIATEVTTVPHTHMQARMHARRHIHTVIMLYTYFHAHAHIL